MPAPSQAGETDQQTDNDNKTDPLEKVQRRPHIHPRGQGAGLSEKVLPNLFLTDEEVFPEAKEGKGVPGRGNSRSGH